MPPSRPTLEPRAHRPEAASPAWARSVRRSAILYVDDEAASLRCFAREYGKTFRILTAANAQAGWNLFRERQEEIAVVLSDQRMPGLSGSWLLDQVRQFDPRKIRILVSTFSRHSDYAAALAGARSGALYTYVVKPWNPADLEQTLRRALADFHREESCRPRPV